MKVKRIVANVAATDPTLAKRFYEDIFGLDLLMDLGWIATYGSSQKMTVQLSFMSESRRLSNQRLRRELKLELRYPTAREGLAGV